MTTHADLVLAAQKILTEYISSPNLPQVDPTTAQAMRRLIRLFDGPEQREADALAARTPSQGLTLNQYSADAIRTCSPQGYQHFFTQKENIGYADHYRHVGLLHALTKISEEAGELWKPFNRALWYGRALDGVELAKMKEEAGDILWYLAGPFCRAMNCTLEQIAAGNIAKLRARYPEAYSDQAATERADKMATKPVSSEGWRLRELSEYQRAAILSNHPGAEDGFYWDADDKAWIRITELWEKVS